MTNRTLQGAGTLPHFAGTEDDFDEPSGALDEISRKQFTNEPVKPPVQQRLAGLLVHSRRPSAP